MHTPEPVLDWLLEPENPAVRYFTLVDLLDRPTDASEVMAARQEIMLRGDAPLLLEGQAEGGDWGEPDAFYTPRFTGAVWRFMLMARIRKCARQPNISLSVHRWTQVLFRAALWPTSRLTIEGRSA
jgi:hypothetical protein